MSDLIIVERKQVCCIEEAISEDATIKEKEFEKIAKYKNLQIEIVQLWQKK